MGKPTDAEIDEVVNRAFEVIDGERRGYFGMSYEQGVVAAIDWMRGHSDEPPFEEDYDE